jgi:hypothetical protein
MSLRYKKMEPMRFKLRRWILGEKNLMLDSLKESQIILKNYLSTDFIEEKGEQFYQIDN